MTSKSTVYGIPTIAIVAFVLLALLGVGMVLYAIFGLSDTSPQEAVPPTAAGVTMAPPSPTPASLPTQTSQPSSAPAKAAPTALAPTSPTSPTEHLGPTLRAGQAVNIRSGPGTDYPVIGGLQPGNDIPVLGQDSGGNWLVIAYASGQGWVAKIVVTVNGDTAGLPVVAAPPAPPTAVPPTAAPTSAPVNPPPASSHGIVGTLNLCDARTTYGVNERICVIEKIYNSTNANVDYGILGVNAANITGGPSWFQSSWTGTLTLAPGCTGPVGTCGGQWDDGFKLSAGTYHFTLDICYSSVAACQNGGSWETLTAPITVVVQ
jgi:hypothetical protein